MSNNEASTLTTSISARPAETVIETSVVRASTSSVDGDSEAPVTVIVTQTRPTATSSETPSQSEPSTGNRTGHTGIPSSFTTSSGTTEPDRSISPTSFHSPNATVIPDPVTGDTAAPSNIYDGVRFNPLSPEAAGIIAAICALVTAVLTTTAIHLHFRHKLKVALRNEHQESKHGRAEQRPASLAATGAQPSAAARPYPGAI